jgi:hypothetical protein
MVGYTLSLFEYEPLNLFGSMNTLLSEEPENDWNNPIFRQEPETPKPWIEYYRQLAIHGELLLIDDIVFKDHWKEYHSWADKWECSCKKTTRLTGVIARTINHQQNAAGDMFDLPSNGSFL